MYLHIHKQFTVPALVPYIQLSFTFTPEQELHLPRIPTAPRQVTLQEAKDKRHLNSKSVLSIGEMVSGAWR